MRWIRLQSACVVSVFIVVSLFSNEPSMEEGSLLPAEDTQSSAVDPENTNVPQEDLVNDTVVPTVLNKQEMDKKTDRFLKGGFCALSALAFLAGLLMVKSHTGQKTV